jgi:four helix bundle suffix protein
MHLQARPFWPRPAFTPGAYGIETALPEAPANTLICLINQASSLPGRQLQQSEQAYLTDGGFTERTYRGRRQARGDSQP